MNQFERVKALLPPVILQLADLIGFKAVEELVKKLGGIQILIGKNLSKMDKVRSDLLISAVGIDNANKITKAFAGELVYIPRCLRALIALRNEMLLQELDELCKNGDSVLIALLKICPKYGVSDRYAWKLLRERNIKQHTLF